MIVTIITAILAFIAGAISGAFAYRTWHRARERRRERQFLEAYSRVIGLSWAPGESIHDFRDRVCDYMRFPGARP